ncbi:MAG: DUF4157 domain-containing protein, partial [Deltaproteobacteria bacterium]|nr:DUF4157 domain-containing protein [Deltaproteobacteria bacterium]
FTPVQTGLLQRKSALCNTPGLVEDSGRDKEKLTLQRSLVDQAGTTTVPRFGHDFSRVSVHSTGPGMIQAKLKINEPGDIYEQEADRVADAVMRMPEPGVQREVEPEEEDEEERLQAKPLAAQITPLIQRKIYPEEDGEELIQSKETSGQTPRLSPILQNQIHSLKGSGHALPQSVRNFFEPRFGYSFGQVRVHNDARAAQLSRGVNARAFTVGQDVVFAAGQYTPETTRGKKLLAHELSHVVQQKTGSTLENRVQCWLAEDHQKITNEVIENGYKKDFSWRAKDLVAKFSGAMDNRIRNYQWYILPKIFGRRYKKTRFHYAREKKEAPNHGEANLYKKKYGTSRTSENVKRMKEWTKKAISKANKSGINDLSLLPLGHALHVAQDRGAHWEGEWGHGHHKKSDASGKKWNCDNMGQNPKGKDKAKKHSKEVFNLFLSKLYPKPKSELSKAKISMKAIRGLELTTGIELTKRKPLFYAGVMFYGLYGRRLRGVFSKMMSGGIAYYGGKKHLIILEGKLGLRIMRRTPRIYVDLFSGVALGKNISDKKLIGGVVAFALKLKYMGSKIDLGIVFKDFYDVFGKQNILVVGVSGRFE